MEMLGSVAQDARYAFRRISKQPGFTGLVALTLALGIGGATTVFSAIQHLLLDPFPYARADGILVFQVGDPAVARGSQRWFFQVPEFRAYQADVPAFAEVIGIDGGRETRVATRDGTEQFSGALVTENTFRFLGVSAAIGRVWSRDDERPGAQPVFVMSHRVWTERFGSDPAMVGRSFLLNDVPTILVGIMPPRFALQAADLWQPLALEQVAQDGRMIVLHARLKPGATVEQAEAQFRLVAARLATAYPRLYPRTFTVKAVTLAESMVGSLRPTLYTFAVAAALLLLIACGNVANMLLARSRSRETEIAIQGALGATRLRLVGQMLVESVMLALLGAGGGCVLANFGLEAIVALIPIGVVPPEATFAMNLPVLLFSLGAAGACTLIFGLLPALQSARAGLTTLLRAPSRSASSRLSGAFVVAEVTLCLVLLSGAGLLTRSFIKMRGIDTGLNPNNLLFVRVRLPPAKYATAESNHRFIAESLQRLQALPGVTAVAAASTVPLNGGFRTGLGVAGRPVETGFTSIVQLCTEGYFGVAEIRLVRGRLLSAADIAAVRRVTVINETLARQYFGGAEAIGQRITLTALERGPIGPVENPVFEIVGIVADTKHRGRINPPLPESFIPLSVAWARGRSLVLRTSLPPSTVARSVQREIQAIDRDVVLLDTGTVTNLLNTFWYAEPLFGMVVLAVFASVALALGLLGVYGVLAHYVSQQTRELGIRMALGALQRDVRDLVLLRGLRLVGLGTVIGLPISLMATRALRSELWGVTPSDPLTLVVVVILVVSAGMAACYIPARRATRVDPAVALRYE